MVGRQGALPKFSDMLTLSQPEGGGADHAYPLALPHLKFSVITQHVTQLQPQ